jgi:hypothetical protein
MSVMSANDPEPTTLAPRIVIFSCMEKLKKTAHDLEQMIVERLGFAVSLKVHPDPEKGWRAIITVPVKTIQTRDLIAKIVAELRSQFDLKE